MEGIMCLSIIMIVVSCLTANVNNLSDFERTHARQPFEPLLANKIRRRYRVLIGIHMLLLGAALSFAIANMLGYLDPPCQQYYSFLNNLG